MGRAALAGRGANLRDVLEEDHRGRQICLNRHLIADLGVVLEVNDLDQLLRALLIYLRPSFDDHVAEV